MIARYVVYSSEEPCTGTESRMVNPVNRIVMKKTIQLISLCLMGILSLGLCSCEQRSEEEVGRALSIKVFAPTRVTPGETVTVSGTGLDKVKSVTLAGNKVTDFKVVNANMLYAQVLRLRVLHGRHR